MFAKKPFDDLQTFGDNVQWTSWTWNFLKDMGLITLDMKLTQHFVIKKHHDNNNIVVLEWWCGKILLLQGLKYNWEQHEFCLLLENPKGVSPIFTVIGTIASLHWNGSDKSKLRFGASLNGQFIFNSLLCEWIKSNSLKTSKPKFLYSDVKDDVKVWSPIIRCIYLQLFYLQ